MVFMTKKPKGSSLKQITVSGDGNHVWGVANNNMISIKRI